MIDNKKHTFVIHARPAGVPLELQNLPGDTAVRVTSDICRTQYEGTTKAEEVMRELKSTIDRQSEGFYTINEVAQIWADATGTDPKRQREKLWKKIEQGRLRPFDEADKFDTLDWSKVKYSCLVRETDLREIGVFPKVPAKFPAQDTATHAPAAVAALVEHDKARPKFSMTKAAMLEQYAHEWPTLERDMKDASANGLAAAKAGCRGWWELDAMEWARANNKLANTSKSASSLTQATNRMVNLPGQKYTLAD